jgi:hypothetical protein
MLHAPSNSQSCLFLCSLAAERSTLLAVFLLKANADSQGRCGLRVKRAAQSRMGSNIQLLSVYSCMTAGRARLLTLLKPSQGGLLWRTAKADVAHELGLPPQHQHTSSLQFSAIERHFYSRQHAECSLRASSTISSQLLSQAAQGLAGQRRLTAAEEKKLLFPLLRLRQACCHPQVGCCFLSHCCRPICLDLLLTLRLSILIAKLTHCTSLTLA